MNAKPRFTLRGILAIILALAVPFALVGTGSETGLPCLVLVSCGCVGYLAGGRDGLLLGLLLSVLAIPTVLATVSVLSMGDF